MASNIHETLIGAVVIAAAAGFLYLAAQSGDYRSGGDYKLSARFVSAEGLVVGSDVRLAGVKVGTLTDLSLDKQTFEAVATLSLDDDIALPEDSEAKVAAEGLLGGSFVEILPGGSPLEMEPGGEFMFTQSAVSFLNLLLNFVTDEGTTE